MRQFILTTITVFLSIGSTTNAQSTVFNKVYDSNNDNNAAFDIIETNDGGYLIAGSSSLNTDLRLWLIKLDNLGDTLWSKKYDMTVGVDYTYSVVELQFGGFILLGTLHDTVTTSAKAYLMKVDEQGDSLWLKQYGSTENDWGYTLAQSPDGGFVCAGWTFNTIDPNYADAWIFKTDSLGTLLWEKQFDNYGLQDNFDKVIITPDGNIVCAGVTVIDAVTGLDYVVKLNQQGDTLWTKQFGGIGAGGIFDINSTQDGGFIGCGAKEGVSGSQRASVYKLDSLGNLLWYNTYARGSGAGEYYSFSAIQELLNGNFMAAGADFDYSQPVPSGSPRIRMMEFNALGDSIWSKQFPHSTGGDEDYMFDMKLTTDGGFIICGYVIHSSPTRNDALVIKIDSNRCDNVPCQLSVGVEETSNFKPQTSNFKVYPNPTTGILTIEPENETTELLNLELYNLLGEKVYNKHVTQNSININHLENGVYFLQLNDKKNKYLATQKLMLQK